MSKIDDVRNYTYRQIQFLIRQKETSVGKAMLANLRRGIGKTPGELPELWGAFLNECRQNFTEIPVCRAKASGLSILH